MTGKDALSQKFTMPEMTARKIIKIGQTETMQMKSLFYYLHSMLIHLLETGLLIQIVHTVIGSGF